MGTATTTGRRTRLGLALLVVLTAALVPAAAALAAPSPPKGPPTTEGPTAAGLGARWLVGQIDAAIPLQVFGSDDWGTTADAALALATTGVGVERARTVWNAIVANRETVVAPDDLSGGPGPFPDNPGSLSKVIQLAHALGEDPRQVGDAPGADLVARLGATLRASGPDAGLYGPADPTYDGVFRQGLSLLALTTAGVTPAPAALAWLEDQQCPDGSWIAYRPDTSLACPTGGFPGPETNATASALVGLVRAGDPAPVAAGLDWLAAVRNDDGGWGFLGGDPTDPNSTAVVLMALTTAGAASQPRFASATAALLSFQLGCADPAADRGSFTFPDTGGKANLYATVQAVPAATGAPLPLTGTEGGDEVPAVDCPPPSTITTTTSTSTSTTSTTTTSTSTTTSSTTTSSTSVPGVSTVPPTAPSTVPASVRAVVVTRSTGGTSLALTGTDLALPGVVGAGLVLGGASALAMRRRTGSR